MRIGVLTIVVILTAGLASAAVAGSPPVKVDPASGGRRSEFTVSVRLPAPAIRSGGLQRSYSVHAQGPSGRRGCVDGDTVAIASADARVRVRVRVRVTLTPRPGRWCHGTYHGQVTETIAPLCPPRELAGRARRFRACPLWVAAPQTIGTFRFRVH